MIRLVCLFLSLFLTEIVLSRNAGYLYFDYYLNLIPVLVFTAITTGNLLGFVKSLQLISNIALLFIILMTTLISLLGLSHFPDFGFIWLSFPYIFYGFLLTRLFSSESLKSIIYAFGFAGAFAYLMLSVFINELSPILEFLTLLAAATAFWSFQFKNKIVTALALVITGAAWAMGQLGHFEPQLMVEKNFEGFKDSKRIAQPYYTPLIRTDLVSNPKGQVIIVTNGRRFAVVSPLEATQKYFTPPSFFIPSYDIPYEFLKPEKTLVIGSAEGHNIRAGIKNNVKSLTAVDINPAVFKIMKNELAHQSANIYNHPSVKTKVSEGRHFLETSQEQFDLITLQGVQTGTHSNLLNSSMIESYLLTEEALEVLWQRTSDKGAIWIEEYKVELNPNMTLVKSIAATAMTILPIENPKNQIFLFEYLQNSANPHGQNRRLREGLLIFKSPQDTAPEAFGTILAKKIKVNDPMTIDVSQTHRKTDNRPRVFKESTLINKVKMACFVFAIFVIGATAIVLRKSKKTKNLKLGVSQIYVGIAFMLFIMGASGPLSLLIGNPQLSTPTLYSITFAFGIIGGQWALQLGSRGLIRALMILCLYTFIILAVITQIKSSLIQVESIYLRTILVSLFLIPIATLIEIPYVWILNQYNGQDRAWSYTLENIGSLLALPIGFWIQFQFGSLGLITALAFVFLFLFIIMRNENYSSARRNLEN